MNELQPEAAGVGRWARHSAILFGAIFVLFFTDWETPGSDTGSGEQASMPLVAISGAVVGAVVGATAFGFARLGKRLRYGPDNTYYY